MIFFYYGSKKIQNGYFNEEERLLALSNTDESSCEHCEDVCLNEGNKKFQAIHKDTKSNSYKCHGTIDGYTHLSSDEHQTAERKNDHMSCQDVGKETDSKGEWFSEHSHEFNRRHEMNTLRNSGTSGQNMLL